MVALINSQSERAFVHLSGIPAAEDRFARISGDGVYAVVPGDVEMTEAEQRALACDKINRLEAALLVSGACSDYPIYSHFIPKNGALASGIYVREAFLPIGIYTTEIHRTDHPYSISAGRARIWTQGDGWSVVSGPKNGVTKAGTRRVFVVEEPMVFTTYHATNETDIEKIRAAITLPHKIVCNESLDCAQMLEALT